MSDPLKMNPDNILRREETEIDVLRRRFNEALCDKDDEIASLRETMKNIVSSLRDGNTFSGADLNVAEYFEVRSELEKYRKLLRESEKGEKELLTALKDCKSALREKEEETKKLKEVFNRHDNCVDLATVEKLRKCLEAKNDEENKIIKLNECLQQAIQEKDLKIEELRLSLWEAQSYCETRSVRLKKLNEENILSKDRELVSLCAEKKRLEQEIEGIRKSSAEKLGLKEAEIERLRKTAANFQDAVKLEDTTISKLRTALEQKEKDLFSVEKSRKLEIEARNEEFERTRQELEDQVRLMETEMQSVKENADMALRDKQLHIDDLIKAIDEENRNSSAEILEKDEEIENLKKKVAEIEEVLRSREEKLEETEDSVKKLLEELSLKLKHHEMEIVHCNSIMESLGKAKEISEQTLSNNIHVLQKKLNETNKEIILNGKTKIKLEKLSKSNKDKELQLAEVKKAVNELEEGNKKLMERVYLLNSNLEDKTSTLDKTMEYVEVLEKEKKDMEEEILCLKRELSESRIKNNKYEMALDDLERSSDETQDEGIRILNERRAGKKSFSLNGKESESELHLADLEFAANNDETFQVWGLDNEDVVKDLEKELKILKLRCTEKEESSFMMRSMLEEAEKMIRNLEARIENLSSAVEEEKDAHTKTAKDMQDLLRMNEALFDEVQKFETLQDKKIEDVRGFDNLLEEEEGGSTTQFLHVRTKASQHRRQIKRGFEDVFGQRKSRKDVVDSREVLLSKMRNSLSEKSIWNNQKFQEMNLLMNQTLVKNTELKALKEKNEQLQELLEKKELEISSEIEVMMNRQKYKKQIEEHKAYKYKVLEEFEKEKEELKQSMMKELAAKEKEIQNLVDCSKETLEKKEEIIAGFKQFIQETATRNKNSLSEKDEMIDSMKKSIVVLKNEKEKLQSTLNDVAERCSSLESKVKNSEESRVKVEEDSRNLLEELHSKIKLRDELNNSLKSDIYNERKVRKNLENEFGKLKEMLKNEEVLAHEAEKVVRHVSDEKDEESKKLRAKEEQCGNLEGALKDMQDIVQVLKQEKKELIKENERLKNNDSKLTNKIDKKQEKIDELKIVITELKETVAQFKQKISKIEQLNLVLRERLDLKSKEYKEKEQEYNNIRFLNDKIREEKDVSLNTLSGFEAQIKNLEDELQNSTKALVEGKTMNSDLKESVESGKALNEKLEKKMAVFEKELKKSEEEISVLEFEIEGLKEAKQTLTLQKDEIGRIKDEEIESLRKELEFSRIYLSQGEDIINNVVREKDNLIQELGKTIETHKNAALTMESYNKSLQHDKEMLLEKSNALESELSERNNMNMELKGALQAAEMSIRFLSEKINELNSVKQALEKKQEENSLLRGKVKEHEKLNEKEMESYRRKMRKNEEEFLKLCEDYQNLENVLRQKEKELKKAESSNNDIKQEYQELREIVDNTNQMNKELERAMLMYKEDAERMENVVSQLKTDNEFLQEFAKDTEKVKLKLNAVEGKDEDDA